MSHVPSCLLCGKRVVASAGRHYELREERQLGRGDLCALHARQFREAQKVLQECEKRRVAAQAIIDAVAAARRAVGAARKFMETSMDAAEMRTTASFLDDSRLTFQPSPEICVDVGEDGQRICDGCGSTRIGPTETVCLACSNREVP